MCEIRFIDLFSGIGGFRLGLERTNMPYTNENRESQENKEEKHGGRQGYDPMERDGFSSKRRTETKWSINGGSKRQPDSIFRCVWSCDNNKYANQVYTKRFGEEGHYTGDIRGVDPSTIPDFDLLCAGFPCQAFSVAGKRKGFQDTRGTLFFEIQRIAESKRPSLLLLENVKGLLNHDGGRTFTVILQSLDELGYWVEWQVLNSKHFGVPQNRERVFIVGHLRGNGGREIFPIRENGCTAYETEVEINGENSLSLTEENAGGWNARGTYIGIPKNAGTLTGGGHSGGLHSDMTIIFDPYNQNTRKDGLAGAVKTNQGSPTSTGTAVEVQPLRFLNRNQKNFDDTAMTVDTTNSTGIRKGSKIRRLTPIECERLQGFPDNWTEGISDTQRYKCLGNAVTVNVIKFLREQIYDCWC